MSEIKALEKLREHIRRENLGGINDRGAFYREGMELVDEIEAEIAESYMPLPAGEDGEILEIGDELECQGKSVLLNSLSWDGKNWYATETIASSGWLPVRMCKHVKPRTLEDVLREMLDREGDGIGLREFNRDFDAFVEHFADEIRAMFGGDAE